MLPVRLWKRHYHSGFCTHPTHIRAHARRHAAGCRCATSTAWHPQLGNSHLRTYRSMQTPIRKDCQIWWVVNIRLADYTKHPETTRTNLYVAAGVARPTVFSLRFPPASSNVGFRQLAGTHFLTVTHLHAGLLPLRLLVSLRMTSPL